MAARRIAGWETRRLELAVTVRARDRAGNKRPKTLRRKPPTR